MAFAPGYIATVSFGGTDISQYVKDVKSNPSRSDTKLPVLGGAAVRRLVGPPASEYDLDLFLDPVIIAMFNAKMAEGTPVAAAFVYHPQGTGGASETAQVFVMNFPKNTPSEGAGTATVKLLVDGAVTYA